MKVMLPLWVAGLCAICQGCSPLADAVRTTILEPVEYSRRVNNLADRKWDQKLAETAWKDFLVDHPDTNYSTDFGLGFKEGYVDYLFAGGPGNPPPVPPRYYWRPEYENPGGHQAIQDWFEGFRWGAMVGRLSGFRELITVPASVALPGRVPSKQPKTTEPVLPLPRVLTPRVGAALPPSPEPNATLQ